MHTDIFVERHPIRYRRLIVFSHQCRISLLVSDAVSSLRSIITSRRVTGHKIRLHHQLPILIEKQMLRSQIDLNIGITIIRCSIRSSCLIIDRRPLFALSGLDLCCQFFSLLLVIHPPAIITAIYCDLLPIAGHKRSGTENRIILLPQSRHIIFHLRLIQRHSESINLQPGTDGASIQNFYVISKPICNRNCPILLKLLQCILKLFAV